jgi:cell division protein ZapA (FtsZ GTPase activity inhibitor)
MDKQVHKLIIAGEEYRIVSEESPEYMQALAKEIDSKISAVVKGSRVSVTQAAVLVALQYADIAEKNSGNADSLRAQMKEHLEDAAKAKSERDFYIYSRNFCRPIWSYIEWIIQLNPQLCFCNFCFNTTY